jgi:CBS domain-containing protein
VSGDLPDVKRLPIREGATQGGKLAVFCPRREVEVEVDECTACGHCVGLSLRDSYLVCGWEAVANQDARVAPEAQGLRHQTSTSAPTSTRLGPAALARFERPVVTAELDDTALAAARRMREHKVGCIVVVRDGRPMGILTDRDLVLRVLAERLDPGEVPVSSVVTYEAATLCRSDGFETAVRTMKKHGVRRLPIVGDDGRVTGIVTADDLIGLLGTELAALGEAIESNVDGTENR